jgi:hypothetical protein
MAPVEKTPIRAGTMVLVRTKSGREVLAQAVTGVVSGRNGPVVWVVSSIAGGRRDRRVPWPAKDVRHAPPEAG